MRAKLSQLDQDRQREDQLLYKLELRLAPSHLMYIAAKGLQLCLAGKQAGPYRQFAQQLSSRKHGPLNALGRKLKQAGLLGKQVSLRQLSQAGCYQWCLACILGHAGRLRSTNDSHSQALGQQFHRGQQVSRPCHGDTGLGVLQELVHVR